MEFCRCRTIPPFCSVAFSPNATPWGDRSPPPPPRGETICMIPGLDEGVSKTKLTRRRETEDARQRQSRHLGGAKAQFLVVSSPCRLVVPIFRSGESRPAEARMVRPPPARADRRAALPGSEGKTQWRRKPRGALRRFAYGAIPGRGTPNPPMGRKVPPGSAETLGFPPEADGPPALGEGQERGTTKDTKDTKEAPGSASLRETRAREGAEMWEPRGSAEHRGNLSASRWELEWAGCVLRPRSDVPAKRARRLLCSGGLRVLPLAAHKEEPRKTRNTRRKGCWGSANLCEESAVSALKRGVGWRFFPPLDESTTLQPKPNHKSIQRFITNFYKNL